jgi:hypothetical protein
LTFNSKKLWPIIHGTKRKKYKSHNNAKALIHFVDVGSMGRKKHINIYNLKIKCKYNSVVSHVQACESSHEAWRDFSISYSNLKIPLLKCILKTLETLKIKELKSVMKHIHLF